MAKHVVVRIDSMSGTTNGAHLKSGKFYATSNPAALDNGQLVALTGMLGRDMYKVEAPAAGVVRSQICLVATPELFYDQSVTHYLDEWTNAAGTALRLYALVPGDRFSVTREAFEETNGEPAVGTYVGYKEGSTKIETQTAKDEKTIGIVREKETVGRYTYYMIEVINQQPAAAGVGG